MIPTGNIKAEFTLIIIKYNKYAGFILQAGAISPSPAGPRVQHE